MKSKKSYISDNGYVKQQDIVGTVALVLSAICIIILVSVGILALITS
ncbi:MAG: hypothetical protein Q4D51_07120 [Eubacteriales bacterium]|nr:hypothetical protein [Eubacteriales bacterium]